MRLRYQGLFRWVVLIIVVGLIALVIIKREWICDFWRGVSYEPSDEIVRIREELDLADYGAFLFNASQPVLSSRDEFNEKCRFERDEEEAILGCYSDKDIYVYNITDKELDGVRECTMAHELLHAVWRRMNENEQSEYEDLLSLVYEQNKEFLKDELDVYGVHERAEELYVRAGTEVKSLPTELERHFATIFRDQDKVVSYYDKYISVFRELKAELDRLKAEMDELESTIKSKEADYAQRVAQLNAEIEEFNQCAETAGCFASQWIFNQRRNVLVNEQVALETLYEEISVLVNEYNLKVDKYNEDVLSSNKLNQMINSTTQVEELGQ